MFGLFDSFSGAGLDRTFPSAGLGSTEGAVYGWRADAPSTRRTPRSSPSSSCDTTDRFCLHWRFHSICLLLIKFKQFSVNFHGCVGMTKAWPWWRRWSHTLPLPLVRRGRGNNPSVPRLGLQPGLHDHHAGLSCLRENECSLNIPCSMLSLETVLG